ncbi:hypothetical protein HMPREF9103_02941 [Lentilactobacillus parafarraginis F0439]|uniref:MrfA-like Zn-binding domain-containing protein n=1 Tax=Lentilactobacillus parafarraginis F0439 TaxID=797515 RepID=G9ZT69_9LACO|nr:DUF1998 domain-containing protein [Lentilactobacillus parafarraginis]EHL95525.1 hypothetical protein HMPREF9103_02941 [Lentilactobacillus parafarraginis F0439]
MVFKEFHPEHNIRRSQLLTPFGTGSLFDINNQTVMMASSELWDKQRCNIIDDPRLRNVMHAAGFLEPPVSDDDTDSSSIFGIRFPTWYLSPQTRHIRKISQWRNLIRKPTKPTLRKFNEHPFDPTIGDSTQELVPVRFVCVCPNGHMQDFPWERWAHHGQPCENPDLKLYSANRSGSISDYIVYCTTCHRRKSLASIFVQPELSAYLYNIGVKCNGMQLWRNGLPHECDQELHVLLRSANNLYFPNISSSVNIPVTASKLINTVKSDHLFNEHYNQIKERVMENHSQAPLQVLMNNPYANMLVREMVGQLQSQFPSLDEKKLTNEMAKDIDAATNFTGDDVKVMDYRREEFNILSGLTEYDNSSDKLKETVLTTDDLSDAGLSDSIESVSLVHQLEVLSALRSFSRLKPSDSDSMSENDAEGDIEEEKNEKPLQEVTLRRDDHYYAAMRSQGEGIFISLNAKMVNAWMKKIQGTSIADRIYKKNCNKGVHEDQKKYITPDYYLIHTLSHIILRELGNSSGYSSTALKERLYFSNELGKEMYGILIYTSSSDSEGTLGGLVKQGIPERLKWILSSAIEKAKWCSFDPVCIESEGQGSDSLNAGACHACALISETSCEKRNQFLDRGVLIGTADHPNLGFFSAL